MLEMFDWLFTIQLVMVAVGLTHLWHIGMLRNIMRDISWGISDWKYNRRKSKRVEKRLKDNRRESV